MGSSPGGVEDGEAGSRRTELADAAIRTLAAEGMRGLTHRAVDRTAGVSEGSSSYYFRTRRALVDAAVDRLLALELAELEHAGAQQDERSRGDGTGAEALVAAAEDLAHLWLTDGRDRLAARYELSLEGMRRPELRARLAVAATSVRATVADQLRAAGVEEPERTAADLVAGVDGLLFAHITAGGGPPTDELLGSIRRLVAALAG
ncbi:MAG: TetR family transcriptional regulator [Actinomycetota bacterium]|nr:TetR family transcriptional regulator [Actinomycetota bacterium]